MGYRMQEARMPKHNGDKDDEFWYDSVTEEDVNVDDEFKSAEEYVDEYDGWF